MGFDVGGTNDHFGAQGLEDIDLFLGLLVGRGENTFISFDYGCQGQSHAGITGGAFDDGATGLQFAFLFGYFHHFEGHTVFGGVAGIKIFYLRQYGTGQFFGYFIQPDQGSMPDCFQNIAFDIHASDLLWRKDIEFTLCALD
jgi:hypothetical protein